MSVKEVLESNRLDIILAYENGESTCSLGRKYGCSNGAVWKFLEANGVEIRKTKVLDDNMEKIKELHLQGISNYKIAQMLSIGSSSVDRAVKMMGYDVSSRQWKREDPLKDHEEEILSLYESGVGSYLIAKQFDTKDNVILWFLKERGVEIRPLRQINFNLEFFDKIDTEEKAYVLGFFYADGSNASSGNYAILSITDEDILREIASVVGYPQGEIKKSYSKNERHLPRFSMSLCSTHISQALTKQGCMPKKTYLARFPTEAQVPRNLQRYFILGAMDGDGTITYSKNELRSWHMRIVGTEAICRGLSKAVQDHLGFPASVCPVHKGPKHTTWGFTVGGCDQLKTFLNWLYKDVKIFMARKRKKYEEFLAASPTRRYD